VDEVQRRHKSERKTRNTGKSSARKGRSVHAMMRTARATDREGDLHERVEEEVVVQRGERQEGQHGDHGQHTRARPGAAKP